MLTKREIHIIRIEFEKLLDNKFDNLGKKLDLISDNTEQYSKRLEAIDKKFDIFIALLKKFSERQNIMEAKMQLIEEYFDPHPRN